MLSLARLRRADIRARVIRKAWERAGYPTLTAPLSNLNTVLAEWQGVREFAYHAVVKHPFRVFRYLEKARDTGSPTGGGHLEEIRKLIREEAE